jgi:hypothetical protein
MTRGQGPQFPLCRVQRVARELPHWIDRPDGGCRTMRLSFSEIDRPYFGLNEGDAP